MSLALGRTPATVDPAAAALPELTRSIGAVVDRLAELRQEVATDRGVKTRGARYLPVPATSAATPRRVLSWSPCRWVGYLLTETTGTGPLVLQVGDGESEGDDPVGQIVVPAGGTVHIQLHHGVGMTRGFVLTPVSGTGSVTGSVYLR